jgi:chitodextrinase
MQNKSGVPNVKKISVKVYAAIAFLMMLSALTAQVPWTYAESDTRILIDPSFIKANPGDNVTITVNITNVVDLFAWQIALKYNGTIIKFSALWIPEDNVFAGQITVSVEAQFGKDVKDGLDWILYGNSLILTSVSVSNSILFKANFTVETYGETTILVTTNDKPAHFGINPWDTWYSFLVDSAGTEMSYKAGSSTVISGEANAKPIALFSIISPQVDNTTSLVLEGHKPPGDVRYAQSYKGFLNGFNASASYDPEGSITSYVWDFGDGNVTVASDPFVSHVYDAAGTYTVRLKVLDNGDPPLESDPYSYIVVVGLILQYFSWAPFEYTVLAIIVIVIVLYATREVRRGVRRRVEKKGTVVAEAIS